MESKKLLTSSYLKPLNQFLIGVSEGEKCVQGDCFTVRSVYQLYFGGALFHVILAVILSICMRSERLFHLAGVLHNELWALKFPTWIGLIFLSTKIPNHIIDFMGTHIFTICALVFVIIQSIISIEFAYFACDKIKGKYDEGLKFPLEILIAAGTLGAIALEAVISVLVIAIASKNSCNEFKWIMALNMVLCAITLAISVIHRVQESSPYSGLTLTSMVTLYSTYTVLGALLSNNKVTCSAFESSGNITTFAPALTWVVTFVYLMHTTVYSAQMSYIIRPPDGYAEPLLEDSYFEDRVLCERTFFLMDTTGDNYLYIDKNTIFSYSFYHIVFACSLMYTAKFFTNWSVVGHIDEDTYSHPTNISLYIRICTAWATLGVLVWTLVAPIFSPS